MNRIRLICRLAGVLAGLACTLLAFAAAAPASFAMVPRPGPPVGSVVPAPSAQVVSGGMPGWQITLIAVGAALAAAAVAVLLDRARAASLEPRSLFRCSN